MKKPIIHYIFKVQYAIVFAAVGLTIFFMSIGNKSMAKKSDSWPSTKGLVTSSEFKRAIFVIDSNFAKKRKPTKYYKLKVAYEYEVDGETYTSNNVSFMSNYIHRDMRSAIKDKFEEGRPIQVYYDPNNAEEAVLIKGVNDYNKNPQALTGKVLFVLGVIGMIYWCVHRVNQS